MATPNHSAVTLSWHIPALIERPAVGTSCCATTAEALLSSELFLLPGVLDLAVDAARGRLDIVTDPARIDSGAISLALGARPTETGLALAGVALLSLDAAAQTATTPVPSVETRPELRLLKLPSSVLRCWARMAASACRWNRATS